MTDRALALAAAVRVIARVHDCAAYRGFDTHVARLARFTEADDLVFDVADLADRRPAYHRNEIGRASCRERV